MQWIVKFGGSQYSNINLASAIRHIQTIKSQPIVVPGGGPFADQVRRAQKRWFFDDKTAHKMALLAMRQYGLLLANIGGLALADRVIPEKPCVWLPDENACYLRANWHCTSDSIAAWLAQKTDARYLVLLKACSTKPLHSLVDREFMDFSKQIKARVVVLDLKEWMELSGVHDLA